MTMHIIVIMVYKYGTVNEILNHSDFNSVGSCLSSILHWVHSFWFIINFLIPIRKLCWHINIYICTHKKKYIQNNYYRVRRHKLQIYYDNYRLNVCISSKFIYWYLIFDKMVFEVRVWKIIRSWG